MATESTQPNGRNGLEQAMVLLINNQAAFVNRLAETDRLHLEFERRQMEYARETSERFARIEAQMAEVIRVLNEHGRILNEHGRILECLTTAVREKIGFKAP